MDFIKNLMADPITKQAIALERKHKGSQAEAILAAVLDSSFSFDVLRKLIDRRPSGLFGVANRHGQSALHIASTPGTLKVLKEYYASEEVFIEALKTAQDRDGNTPLHFWALHGAQRGYFQNLQYAAQDLKIDLETVVNAKGETVLYVAHYGAKPGNALKPGDVYELIALVNRQQGRG